MKYYFKNMNDPVRQLWSPEPVLSVHVYRPCHLQSWSRALPQSSGQDSVCSWIPFVGQKAEAWSRFRGRGRRQSILETTTKENG